MTTAAAGPALQAHFEYPRFQDPGRVRALVLEPTYYLAAELRGALSRRGHTVETVAVAKDAAEWSGYLQRLLLTAAKLRPDFVLAINHHGFDEEGNLAALLASLRVPVAVWYVDDPEPITRGGGTLCNEMTSLFLWDQILVERERARRRFGSVDWLPLAADSERVASGVVTADSGPAVCFVGSSWRSLVETAARKLDPGIVQACEPAVLALAKDGCVPAEGLAAMAGLDQLAPAKRAEAIAYIQRAASRDYRRNVLATIPAADLTIIGDPAWRQFLPNVSCRPQTDYYRETDSVYRSARVTLNVTSRQMPSGVNQRVFDVPAAGGFVLSDAQGDSESLFPAGAAATYASIEEAADKVRFYVGRPDERRRISEAARAEILRRHLYEHRVDTLVDRMRARYA